jgi:hypothetical protein
MEAADFSQMSIDMHQILGRQIPDDTTATKMSTERHSLKIFLLSAALAGEFQMNVANDFLLPNSFQHTIHDNFQT